MKACRSGRHRAVCHVKQVRRLQRFASLEAEALVLCTRSARSARRWAVLLQLLAATGCHGCVCNCVSKFETACAETHGVVLSSGTQSHCMKEGAVVATWVTDDDGGEP